MLLLLVWAEKDLKDHLIPNPCHGKGQFPLDRGAVIVESPILSLQGCSPVPHRNLS